MTATVSRELAIRNRLGLHARAATRLATLAMQFDAEITVSHGDRSASAASVMGLLLLQSRQGQSVTVHAEGPDADQALNAVSQLFESRFDEDE